MTSCFSRGSVDYWLLPHAGSWETAGLARKALELNQRPVALVETYHSGALPSRDAFLEVNPPGVVATVLKRAEDSEDIILRLYETEGKVCKAQVDFSLLGRKFEVEFSPHQIKTLLVPRGEGEVREVNLLEWQEQVNR